MNDVATAPKAKKSVALSGVAAGNTALCTVGRTGNDLHYRGYDILDIADACEFEEIAYLLVHGKLPNRGGARGLQGEAPVAARPARRRCATALEALPARRASDGRACAPAARRSAACCPRRTITTCPGARDIADRLMASFGSMLLYWYHFSHNGRRIEVETDDDSIGGHFLHLLHGRKPSRHVGAARCTPR